MATRRWIVAMLGGTLLLGACSAGREVPTLEPRVPATIRPGQQTLAPVVPPDTDPSAAVPDDSSLPPLDPDPDPDPLSDICPTLGADWSTQRMLGRGIEFHAPKLPDSTLDLVKAERGTLILYNGTDPAGYATNWDAWWVMWRSVQAQGGTAARRWAVIERDGRFYPFEARTPDFTPYVDPHTNEIDPDVRPPQGPCRFGPEDGTMIAWTAINLHTLPGTLEMDWLRYTWTVPSMLDCAALAAPCGPGNNGVEWWCVHEDISAVVAPGWGNCNIEPRG